MCSCNRPSEASAEKELNDSALVLNMLFDSVLVYPKIPDWQYLVDTQGQYYHPFGDAIMVMDHPIFKDYIPMVSGYQLKFVSFDTLCEIMRGRDIMDAPLGHVLVITHFSKTDSVYSVSIENTAIMRWFDKSGKPYKNPMSGKLYEGEDTCVFMTSGGMALTVTKSDNLLRSEISAMAIH